MTPADLASIEADCVAVYTDGASFDGQGNVTISVAAFNRLLDAKFARDRMLRGLKQIASCKVVSVDPPDCPQIARNLLAGREWSEVE